MAGQTYYLHRADKTVIPYRHCTAAPVFKASPATYKSQGYHHTFAHPGPVWNAYGTIAYPTGSAKVIQAVAAQKGVMYVPDALTVQKVGTADYLGAWTETGIVLGATAVSLKISDDVAQRSLRQDDLSVTQWEITINHDGSTERKLLADYLPGDTWSNAPTLGMDDDAPDDA